MCASPSGSARPCGSETQTGGPFAINLQEQQHATAGAMSESCERRAAGRPLVLATEKLAGAPLHLGRAVGGLHFLHVGLELRVLQLLHHRLLEQGRVPQSARRGLVPASGAAAEASG